MRDRSVSALVHACLLVMTLALLASNSATRASEPESSLAGTALLRANCSGCHVEQTPRHFDRISYILKSPEGWEMTLFRMKQVHGLELSQDVHAAVLRLLADSQGLAPAQSAAGRFAVERRPNVKDMTSEADADRLCGACHTHARLSLQRRDTAEWLKLMNTHVGQWPTIEYHAQLRTRPWWPIVTTQVAPALGRCVWRVNGRDL